MNQYESDAESEDGQLTPDDEISHDDGDTADSLDIKPPQANRDIRYREKKSSKDKKHSRDRRQKIHVERERDERHHRHNNIEKDHRYDGNLVPRKPDIEILRYEQHREQQYQKNSQKERHRDRRKENSSGDKSEADKILDDLRSRLLSKRNKFESEKKSDDWVSSGNEYEGRRNEKDHTQKYEYENRREKHDDRRENQHYREHHREKKTMIEVLDSPEDREYSDDVQTVHHKSSHKERERRPMTADDKEQAARRARLIEAERELTKRKEMAREELEARREMRREREETKRDSTSPINDDPPRRESKKKRRISDGEIEEKKKRKRNDEVVTVSDNSDDDTISDSSSSSSSQTDDDEDEDAKEDSDGELPNSPLSVGELTKSSNTRTNHKSRSRSHTRSRSLTTTPRSKSRSRSPNIRHSRSKTPPEDDEDLFKEKRKALPSEDIVQIVIAPVEEEKEIFPAYFPGIQGCRSVEEFQCLNRIEEGTYGVVYRAKDKRTEEIVALKRLKMEKEKEGFPITSLREINTLLKGQHGNIVTVREIVVGSNMDKIFIVMDYVEHDLKSLMETMKHKKQVFLPGEVKCLTQQLIRAVGHLHDNWILHRDLKTSNLLLSHKGILKVGDFGLAREYGSPLKPYTAIVVTLWYRAPELLLCCKQYSTPIDLWSVGCIFAEFLAMTALFPGKSEVDQLNRIFKDLGTPNERIWPGYSELPAVQKMTFTEYPVSNLRKKFSHLTSEIGLSLLQGLLTYDPKQRFSADHALQSSYFKELPLPIDPAMFPTWPAKSELGSWKPTASPKPPSGGSEFKNLVADDDPRWGAAQIESRQLAMGPGFSLKF